MAEYTPNLGLYKPNRNDSEEVDVTLSENFSKIDTEFTSVTMQLADIATTPKRLATETTDTQALQRAVDTGKPVLINGKLTITAPIVINTHSQKIFGYGKGSSAQYSSQIISDQDIEFFQVKANYITFDGLSLYCSNTTHSKKHIQGYDVVDMRVVNCRLEGKDSTLATGSGIGFNNGLGGYGGSMGVVDNCILSHASVDIESSDVHVTNSWIWANSRPYGVKVKGTSSNITFNTVDFLPPRTEVPNAKAGLYITGASAQPKVIGCYFDGNFTLSTGTGCLIENGTIAPMVSNCHFNGLNRDALILDSVLVPIVKGNTFYNNNLSGNGSVDILLRQTFAQTLEKPLVEGNSHIQTAAITGTVGAAIKVQTGTAKRRMRIINNTIQQPGTGGGYSDVEIFLEDGYFASPIEGSLSGNAGSRRVYSVSGSAVMPANDSFETITFSNSLAYEPRLDQYVTNIEGGDGAATYRLQKSGAINSVQVGMPATHVQFTLHYLVSL